MPWKGEKDPYKIWISEIILQQTRVEQGWKYYQRFLAAFPNVHALSNASDQKVYKLWEGLGYYSRCRNLIDTARYIARELNGQFPKKYEEIKKLKGIGPYTAAAISSFAFNEPYAVVDGNVFRVLSRIFGIAIPIDVAAGKKFFNQFADNLLDKQQPGLFNQSIMDFGATICRPIPQCGPCPFNKYCKALSGRRVLSLPVKTKQTIIRKRWFYYMLLEYRGKFAIRKRTGKDIWCNLFEFFLLESRTPLSENEMLKRIKKTIWIGKNGVEIKSLSPVFQQKLTHQIIEGRFVNLKLLHKPDFPDDVTWVKKAEIRNYAFPKFINQYLQKFEI